MLSKRSAEVLLKMLAQSSVCPLAPEADNNYQALAQARDELKAIISELKQEQTGVE